MREAIGFRHGQRIHIGTNPKPALAVPVPQHAHNAGLANAAMHLNPPGSEALATSALVRTSSNPNSGWAWKSRRQAVSSSCHSRIFSTGVTRLILNVMLAMRKL
jgi:hypothetical protein